MAKRIYTYLYDDDLNGSCYVTMDNCSCKLYRILRTDSGFLQEFKEELEKPALYILLNRQKRKAYVGETDAFLTRLSQHIAKKNFWSEVLAFTSNDDSVSKTEVQYLESLAYGAVLSLNSFDLSENTVVPKAPHMNRIQKSKTEDFFKYVQYLTEFIGCDIFEKRKVRLEKAKMPKSKVLLTTTSQGNYVEVTPETIKGKVTIVLNGISTYKARLGVAIVREYLKEHPQKTFVGLKRIFHDGMLGEFVDSSFLEDDIAYAKSLKKELGHYQHQVDHSQVLTSGDGVKFVVSNRWGSDNSMILVQFAKEQGWDIKIKI